MKSTASGWACRVIAGSALGCALVGAGAAQSIPSSSSSVAASSTVTLAQAAESAWQRAIQAREAQGQALRARAEQSAASSLWAAPPALELSHRDDRWQTSTGARETEAGLVWPLWLPGQRDARGAAAGAEVEWAQAAEHAGRLHFASLVREAAWNLAAQRAEADLADAQARYLQSVADDVDRRVKAGDLAHADALAARSELLAANAAQTAARQRLQAGRSQWRVLTGLEALPGLAAPAPPSPPFDLDAHPDARLAALAVVRARKRLDVVNVSRRDPPELLLRIRQDVPGRGEPSRNSIGIGVRIPFGTDGRNQPLQAAALSELDIAQTTAERLRDRLAAEAETARTAVLAAEQQFDTERTRAGLLRERAALIDKSFRAGETPLPELLRTLAAAAQAESGLARQQAALGLARARLQQALGILP